MKNIIAGTAGHIDHGKTALVRALTGIDTDRLIEEKQRGISIDLGFAHLDLSENVRLGFVDVPGHERFIKNMLAGVGGIDLVLFVIAADESIKPQTREHFDICRLLNITKGLVVLTKSDLVDTDILELVRLEVDEFVRGSFLEGAPMLAVSASTGSGLPELRQELLRQAAGIHEKSTARHFRLPIDRAFSMRGFGTVVTGTLISGSVQLEQEVEVFPPRQRVRVRGIQVHGEAVRCATAGQRTALNLAGAESAELARGMTLAAPGLFEQVSRMDCSLDLLPSAKPLRNHAPVHFHAGTAEVEAKIRSLENRDTLAPGTRSYVRIDLRDPVLLLPGDRFIIRMFSPVVTIGGGVILDIAPPRRSDSTRLVLLEKGSAKERLTLLAGESKFGLSLPDLVARTGLLESEIRSAVQSDQLLVFQEPQFWVMHAGVARAKLESIQNVLKKFHREHPLLAGISKEELRSRELPGAPAFVLDALLAQSKTISAKAETVHLSSHKIALKQDEADAVAKIEGAFQSAGLTVPSTQEVLAKSGVETSRGRTLLQLLLKDKKLIRINEELVYHASVLDTLRAMLAAHKGQRFGVPEFKEWTGISRKYAIPLLEFLDRERITRRDGDARVML
ncbi:MAG: selenocysteine-specific translation elongation factor [Acidobacteriota bacterium]|nr:selenocysteine-specific translation elongation factor [Acidobacteriota bacterium]